MIVEIQRFPSEEGREDPFGGDWCSLPGDWSMPAYLQIDHLMPLAHVADRRLALHAAANPTLPTSQLQCLLSCGHEADPEVLFLVVPEAYRGEVMCHLGEKAVSIAFCAEPHGYSTSQSLKTQEMPFGEGFFVYWESWPLPTDPIPGFRNYELLNDAVQAALSEDLFASVCTP
jgi:hypothetical protein